MNHEDRKSQFLLNVPLLIITIIGAAIIAAAGHFWHGMQVGRIADAFLARSEQFAKDGKYADASVALSHYVQMRPDDVEGHIQLAQALDKSSEDLRSRARAIPPYRRAVGLAPGRIDLRQRYAELLLETAQFDEAIVQAREVVEASKKDKKKSPEAYQTLALATFLVAVRDRATNWEPIKATVLEALQENPADLRLAACIADIYRAKLTPPQTELADKAIDTAVEANQRSATALLTRYRYRTRFQLPGADEDLDAALKTAPKDPEVVLAAAERAAGKKQWAQALPLFTSYTELSPSEFRGYLGQAQSQIAQQDRKAAVKTLQLGIEKAKGGEILIGWALADLLIEERDFKEAEKVLNRTQEAIQKNRGIESAGVRESLNAETDFIRAKWWLGQQDGRRAAEILKKLTLTKVAPVEGQKYVGSPVQSQYMLAVALANSGQWDQAANAFEKVLSTQPDAYQARAGAAQANLLSGQIEPAIKHFELLRSQGKTSPEIELMHAQALFQRQVRRPAESRDWKEVASMIEAAAAETSEWLILRADYEIARGETSKAAEALRTAEQKFPNNEACLKAVAIGYDRLEMTADADRVFAKWHEVAKQKSGPLLARSASLARRGQEKEAIDLLTSATATLPEAERVLVQHQLIQFQVRNGNLDAARQSMIKLSEASPDNLQWLKELAELSLESRDFSTVEKCERRLQELEGESGTLWRYFRSRRLLASATRQGDTKLEEAERLASELESTRPTWPEAHLLRGLIAEKQGNVPVAIAAYRKALQLDSSRLPAYERLIQLLYRDKQFDAAEAVLAQLQESQKSARLSHYALALSVQQREVDQALGLANAWVQRTPNDPQARIWLAQTLLLQGQTEQAEAELKKATEVASGDFRAWAPLLMYYVRSKQVPQARETLEQIEKQVKLSSGEKASLLGQGYELIGDAESAARFYREASKLAPSDRNTQQQMAAFLVRTGSADAGQALQQLESSVSSSQERRNLALLHAKRGDSPSLEKALQVLNHDETEPAEAALNNRLKAGILLRRNAPGDHAQALKLLSALVTETSYAIPQDRLMLAGLQEQQGSFTAAKQQYETLASSPKAEPVHWGLLADFLLRRNLTSEAATWIHRLAEKDPESLATVALQARLLHAQKKTDQIEGIVEPIVTRHLSEKKTDQEKAQIGIAAGQLYLQLEQLDPALRHLKQAYSLEPSASVPLVGALVQAKQVAEAVAICEKPENQSTPLLASTLASTLAATNAGTAETEQAEKVFAAAVAKHGDDVGLLMALAGVRFIQQKYDEVKSLSRKVLEKDPNNVLAMNNLASLLAEEPANRAEAIRIIDRAIDISGRMPTLLDTKGVALLYEGQATEAVNLLKEALVGAPNDSRFLFHLAVGYQRMGDRELAKQKLQAARQANLTVGLLTPTERKLLEELARYVGENPTATTATNSL